MRGHDYGAPVCPVYLSSGCHGNARVVQNCFRWHLMGACTLECDRKVSFSLSLLSSSLLSTSRTLSLSFFPPRAGMPVGGAGVHAQGDLRADGQPRQRSHLVHLTWRLPARLHLIQWPPPPPPRRCAATSAAANAANAATAATAAPAPVASAAYLNTPPPLNASGKPERLPLFSIEGDAIAPPPPEIMLNAAAAAGSNAEPVRHDGARKVDGLAARSKREESQSVIPGGDWLSADWVLAVFIVGLNAHLCIHVFNSGTLVERPYLICLRNESRGRGSSGACQGRQPAALALVLAPLSTSADLILCKADSDGEFLLCLDSAVGWPGFRVAGSLCSGRLFLDHTGKVAAGHIIHYPLIEVLIESCVAAQRQDFPGPAGPTASSSF
ncbi:Hypothetical predicted protein [Olea europaea subsp. europaea]|uniref:Uncharacterized protein n=1 Tax=Olea europaea subsp. europaea TaxID=158383 RepID=A0A8S0UR37_OLEEU|nr:Hypothetical predicted protein [Olea europaea subsp. europaea]